MSLIHKRFEVLDYVTNLIASFDVIDEYTCKEIFGVSLATVKQVKTNIIHCAKHQKDNNFIMTINCVVIPETVRYVKEVMKFCFEHNIRFAIVPAELEGGEINDHLLNNKEYQDLMRNMSMKMRHPWS